MSLPERSPHIRVLPRAGTLDIILKNTHFPDGLLEETADVQCRVEWTNTIPVLIFQFKSAVHDFSEPLVPSELKNSERGWLDRQPIQLRLLLADNVITDHVTERVFFLAKNESDEIRKVFELATMPSFTHSVNHSIIQHALPNTPDSAVPDSDSPATPHAAAASGNPGSH